MQCRLDSMGVSSREDVLNGLEHFGLLPVETGGITHTRQADGQVRRADVEPVQSRRSGDFSKIVHGFAGFDHGEAEHIFIGLPAIVGTRGNARTGRTKTAHAHRGITHIGHQSCRLLGGVDHWADHSVGSGIQCLHDAACLQPGHSHHGRHAAGTHGLEHAHRGLIVHDAVLQVDG
ncbi:hypothetical protein D3C86_1200730 [compost metagenome]